MWRAADQKQLVMKAPSRYEALQVAKEELEESDPKREEISRSSLITQATYASKARLVELNYVQWHRPLRRR
jgi:hypothetical protein